MQALRVVWINPSARRHDWRCVPLQIAPDRRVYLVEQLVTQGDRRYWTKSSALEMLYGGQPYVSRARRGSKPVPAANPACSEPARPNRIG